MIHFCLELEIFSVCNNFRVFILSFLRHPELSIISFLCQAQLVLVRINIQNPISGL